MRPVVTALYVPADRPDRFGKALASGADVVIIDLEDAVAATGKDAARAALNSLAEQWDGGPPQLQVRVNARGSAWHQDDLRTVAELPVRVGLRLPKTQSADDIDAVRTSCPGRAVHALIESALAVERAFEIASAGVASVGLGEADLRGELGVPPGLAGEPGLGWARSRIVNAAAAAGLPAPLMSVYPDVADLAGLEDSCRAGRSLGFGGRAAIHPRQLALIQGVFEPSPEEVARAELIITRVGSAIADGAGTVVLDDGTFLDVAMVRSAWRILGHDS